MEFQTAILAASCAFAAVAEKTTPQEFLENINAGIKWEWDLSDKLIDNEVKYYTEHPEDHLIHTTIWSIEQAKKKYRKNRSDLKKLKIGISKKIKVSDKEKLLKKNANLFDQLASDSCIIAKNTWALQLMFFPLE